MWAVLNANCMQYILTATWYCTATCERPRLLSFSTLMIFLPPVNRLVIAQVKINLTKYVGPTKEWRDSGCGLKSRTDMLNATPIVDSGCVDAVILKASTRERFWIWIPFPPLGVDTHTHCKQGQRRTLTEWYRRGGGGTYSAEWQLVSDHWPLQSYT